jgi:hypothetical protein
MDASLRKLVRERAARRCEYCLLPESVVDVPFHVEHIIAKQHGGDEGDANLCLACDRCNFYKGPNHSSIDHETGLVVGLFHPRQHQWEEHFFVSGPKILGLTAVGRATVRLLNMNAKRRLQLRSKLIAQGRD